MAAYVAASSDLRVVGYAGGLQLFQAADIVLADWRDALPKVADKLRPAVVVGSSELFDPG